MSDTDFQELLQMIDEKKPPISVIAVHITQNQLSMTESQCDTVTQKIESYGAKYF